MNLYSENTVDARTKKTPFRGLCNDVWLPVLVPSFVQCSVLACEVLLF